MFREFRLATFISWNGYIHDHCASCLISFFRGAITGLLEPILPCRIAQGGPGLPIFPDAVLNYFSQGIITGVNIDMQSLPLHLKYLFEQVILLLT